MDLMLLFAVFTVGFFLGAWLGYYVGSHREAES
jgi:membrane protein DedA with SNARE-associated domain